MQCLISANCRRCTTLRKAAAATRSIMLPWSLHLASPSAYPVSTLAAPLCFTHHRCAHSFRPRALANLFAPALRLRPRQLCSGNFDGYIFRKKLNYSKLDSNVLAVLRVGFRDFILFYELEKQVYIFSTKSMIILNNFSEL